MPYPGVTTPAPIRRVVTGHDSTGAAVFLHDDEVQSTSFVERPGVIARFTVPWTTDGLPVDCQTGEDQALAKIDELILPNGSVLRYVDFPPHGASPMHRTQSMDYGIVIYGEIELELDNGATKVIRESDVVIQQGTIHAWQNKTDKYARMAFILISAKPIAIDGKPLSDVSIH